MVPLIQTVRKKLSSSVIGTLMIGAAIFFVLIFVSGAFARTRYVPAPTPPAPPPAEPSNGASAPNANMPSNYVPPASAAGAGTNGAGAAVAAGVAQQNSAALATSPPATQGQTTNFQQGVPGGGGFQPSQTRSLSPTDNNPDAGAAGPKAEFNSPEGYSFNPLRVKRDPFTPPAATRKSTENAMELYDLSQMKLVAIMQGFGSPQAMIVLPDGQTHIIKEGDTIGKRAGKVSKITPSEVQVKESFKDFQNRVKTDLTAMVLAE